MTPMRVVSAYRPFAPESGAHKELGPFDWVGALRMLAASVRRSCHCDTVALTDPRTPLPLPAFRYETESTRLMLWILEVSLRYLESADFDRDTVFVSPDTLVLGDLRPFFAGDLTLLVRSAPKYQNRPILNAVQWWPLESRDRLINFYRQALALAQDLPDNCIRWGADSESLRRMIAPLEIGIHHRAGLRVSMREAISVLYSVTGSTRTALAAGHAPALNYPVIDFKGLRKRDMRAYFQAVMPEAVLA